MVRGRRSRWGTTPMGESRRPGNPPPDRAHVGRIPVGLPAADRLASRVSLLAGKYRSMASSATFQPPAASAATTSETTGTSTTDNMSSSVNGFVYRRVDSGQSDAQVLRYIMERRGGHDAPDNTKDTSVSISLEEGMTILSQDASESIQMARDISALISNSSFDGVFFEMPGVDSATVSTTPFEFVLVNAPSLAQFAESHPDRYAFEEHLDKCEERQTCCAFNNLGGDARLIAPRMMVDHGQEDSRVYSHLASFVRGADEGQIVDMWQLSASEYLRTVRGRGPTKGARTWFSTSGMGVAWLHVRLDSFPKYYQYGPFKL